MENIEVVKDKIIGIVKAHYYVSIITVLVVIFILFWGYKYGFGISKVSKMLSGRDSGNTLEDEMDDLIDSIKGKQQSNLNKKRRK